MSGRLLDPKFRYRSALKTSEPGYLARRFSAIRRLERMRARKTNVTTIPQRKASHG